MTFLNQPTRRAAIANAALAVLAAVIVNGLIFGLGLNNQDPTFDRVSFAPPGWVVGCIWCLLFALYGIARWRAASFGQLGAARWVTGLMSWALAYPITSGGFLPGPGQLVNAVSLLFSLFVYWRLRRCAPPAGLWLLPSLGWIGFATIWGIAALS